MRNPYVVPHRWLAYQNVIDRICTIRTHSATGIISGTVEMILADLVHEQMVDLARQGSVYKPQTNLLPQAIALTESNLRQRLDGYFDFDPYFEGIRDKLKDSAKEIAYLQEQLKKTRQQQQLGIRRRFEDADVPFEINEIGLINASEGLTSIPLVENGCYLNIEEIRRFYNIEITEDEGILFPFWIKAGELEFVVDDDGSIFISTRNFPASLIADARGGLEHLARRIYIN